MRLAMLATLLLSRFALADWWHVSGPAPGPVPVNPPKCVANCDDAPSPAQQQQPSNRNTRDPEAEARQRAAEEAARREAQRQAEEARREFEAVRDATDRLGDVGSSTREQSRRFDDYRDRLERRETHVRSLERVLAPVLEKPAVGARTPLSMKEYCDRLNAAAPPPRSLRVSDVPLPSPQSGARTVAFEAPPSIPPGRFTDVTAAIKKAREALKEEAKETAETLGWRYLDQHVPFLKSARESFESVKQNYEALSGMTTRLATSAFTHAEDVALTVGGAGGTATPEENDRVLRSMGRDVNETTSKLLADQARGAIKDSMLDKVSDWFFPGEEP